MSVEFKHGRLFVGWRRCDWRKVWYVPCTDEDVEVDDDGTMPMNLFKFATGDSSKREPMEAEVVFLAHFCTDKGDADGKGGKKTREVMQMQFIYDAWRYLHERDVDQVKQLEQDLDNPDYRKWQSWFNEAKKFKRKQIKRLVATRGRRRRAAQGIANVIGANLAELDFNSDSSNSGEDSGFESEDERQRVARRAGNCSTGLGLVNKSLLGSKRPAPGGGPSGNASKKPSQGPKGPQKPCGKRGKAASPPRMSGIAAGFRCGRKGLGHCISEDMFGKASTVGSESDVDDDDGMDENASMYDTRPSDHASRGGPSSSDGQAGAMSPPSRPSARSSKMNRSTGSPSLFVRQSRALAAAQEEDRPDISLRENERNEALNGHVGTEDEAYTEAVRRSSEAPETRNGDA